MIEVSEIVVHDADEPDALAHLFDADSLAGEDVAQVDLAPVVADAATVGDGGCPIVERIVEVAQAPVGPGRRGVELSRDPMPAWPSSARIVYGPSVEPAATEMVRADYSPRAMGAYP